MNRQTPPDVDRVAAARAAVAARRGRAAVKASIASRERRALEVAEAAWAGEPTAPEATLRVRELLMSIPSLGPTRADRVMEQLGIAASKRVGGLGIRQRDKLREYLIQREGGRRTKSRLVVLAGPTAVGKGTRVALHPRELSGRARSASRPRRGRRASARSTASTTTSCPTPSSTT